MTVILILMKLLLSLVTFLLFCAAGSAQYYYFDVVNTKIANQNYRLLRSNEVRKIQATSFDGNEPSKDFVLQQTIAPDGSKIVTRTASSGTSESYFTAHYRNNRLIKTVDSSSNAINSVEYQYDNTGKIISVVSASSDFDGSFTNREVHQWQYNENGLPERMYKIKNSVDTTTVVFSYEDGLVAEEKWWRNNRNTETYYYYHNQKKQLTDIVRFNRRANKMLPDYIFEYDGQGRISQMTQTQSAAANYLTWKYLYNDKGLKEKEVAFNKQKEMLGRIEYKYQ